MGNTHDLKRSWNCPECENKIRPPKKDDTPILKSNPPIIKSSVPALDDTFNELGHNQSTTSGLIGVLEEDLLGPTCEFENITFRTKPVTLEGIRIIVREEITKVLKQLLPNALRDHLTESIEKITLCLEQRLTSSAQSLAIPSSEETSLPGVDTEKTNHVPCQTERIPALGSDAVKAPIPSASNVINNNKKKKNNVTTTDSFTKEPQLNKNKNKLDTPSEVLTVNEKNTSDSDESAWQVYSTKKQRKSLRAIVQGSGQKHELLETVERTRKMHACFFKPETTPEMIEKYMKQFCDCNVKADKLKLKHNYYASFILSVPESKFEVFMASETWPEGTQVSEWFRRAGRAPRDHPSHAPGQRKS